MFATTTYNGKTHNSEMQHVDCLLSDQLEPNMEFLPHSRTSIGVSDNKSRDCIMRNGSPTLIRELPFARWIGVRLPGVDLQ